MKTNKSFFIFALFSVGLLFAFNTNAQTSPWKKKESPHQNMMPFPKLNLKQDKGHFPNNKNRPTAVQGRLTSKVFFMNDGTMFVPEDSTAYYWLGNNNNIHIADHILANDYYFAYPQNILNEYAIMTAENILDRMAPFENININSDSTSVRYAWDDGMNAFDKESRNDITLDANGNVSTLIRKKYDGANFVNYWKNSFIYDAQFRVTDFISQEWYGSFYENVEKEIYTIDAQGRLSFYTVAYWNIGTSSWENSRRMVLYYTTQDLVETIVHQNWSGTAWINENRSSVTYSTGNSIRVSSDWDGTQWVNFFKEDIFYDAQERPIISKSYLWDGSNWVEHLYYGFSYDGSGNFSALEADRWDVNLWINMDSYIYSHNSNNKLTKVIYESFNEITNSFDTIDRVSYTYNPTNQFTSLLQESWIGSSWTPNDYGNEKIIFNYELLDDGTGVVPILNENDFSFYPNPANEKLNLKMNNSKLITGISITDISGRVVYKNQSQLNASQLSIPLNNLSDGVYFLQIYSEGQKGAKSFVVKH